MRTGMKILIITLLVCGTKQIMETVEKTWPTLPAECATADCISYAGSLPPFERTFSNITSQFSHTRNMPLWNTLIILSATAAWWVVVILGYIALVSLRQRGEQCCESSKSTIEV